MKTLSILMFTILLTGCGSMDAPSISTVQAAAPPTTCAPEYFFDGPSGDGNGIEGPFTLWFAMDACDLGTRVDQKYITRENHLVQSYTMQMGSNLGSIFEWDQTFTITRPDGKVVIFKQQQYDKHSATERGNFQVTYNLVQPVMVPASSVVRLVRREQPLDHCIQGGRWGNTQACATGGSVQLQDVVP